MDFKDLSSEETLQKGLNWIADYIQGAMLNHEHSLKFTFSPNEENGLEDIFDFCLKLKDKLITYNVVTWCILNNNDNVVQMKILF